MQSVFPFHSRRSFLVSMVLLFAFACTPSAQASDISVEQLATALQSKDFLLVDVRTPAEHQAGMIPGTDMLIPYDRIVGQWDPKTVPLDKPIVVYCQSGGRSSVAQRTLRKMGYTHIRNLTGGIGAWSRGGQKIVKP